MQAPKSLFVMTHPLLSPAVNRNTKCIQQPMLSLQRLLCSSHIKSQTYSPISTPELKAMPTPYIPIFPPHSLKKPAPHPTSTSSAYHSRTSPPSPPTPPPSPPARSPLAVSTPRASPTPSSQIFYYPLPNQPSSAQQPTSPESWSRRDGVGGIDGAYISRTADTQPCSARTQP